MADKMYWAARCKRCSGMVGYREVRYVVALDGVNGEEVLPARGMRRRCDHCGTVSEFNLQNLRPTPLKLLVPQLP
jgi:hypothetical protein